MKKENDFNAESDQSFKKESADLYGKIWRAPDDKENGNPKFLMSCPVCEKVCSGFVEHFKSNHKDMDWRGIRTPCPFEDCDKIIVDIQNHITNVHLKIRNFECNICYAKFSNNGLVEKHIDGVHSNIRETCPHCDESFKITSLKTRIKNVHEGGKVKIACTETGCSKALWSKNDMERHVASVHRRIRVPCPECGKGLRMDTLAKHIEVQHNKIYPFVCEQCKKGFQFTYDLETHIRTKHNGEFYICEITNSKQEMCGKKLRNQDALRHHVKRVHLKIVDMKKTPCPECGNEIFLESLKRHIEGVHLKSKRESCTIENCGEVYTNKYSLQRHVDKVHNKLDTREWCELCKEFKQNLKNHIKNTHVKTEDHEKFPCPQCSYKAKTRYILGIHIKGVHEENPMVECDECGKEVKNLYSHRRSIHIKRVDKHFCERCDKGFPTKFRLKDHVNKIHLKLRSTCPECGVEVAASFLKNHQRYTHEKRMAFVCDISACDTGFTSKQSKIRHMQQVHQGIRDKCPECGKKVTNVQQHNKIVHKKERPHHCEECKKTFKTKPHLKNHVKTSHLGMTVDCPECGKKTTNIYSHRAYYHTLKVKSFICDHCEKICKTSKVLKMHILSVHKGVKENCEICDKNFAVGYIEAHRRSHVKTEDEKKPHKCVECEKSFPDPYNLKKHVKRAHLGITEECPRCGIKTKDIYRHMKYTNCESEMYTPRQRKIKIGKRDKFRNIKSYFENIFKDPETIEKYNQRTNLDIKEECPGCGTQCKDLYLHMKECRNEQKNYQEKVIDDQKIEVNSREDNSESKEDKKKLRISDFNISEPGYPYSLSYDPKTEKSSIECDFIGESKDKCNFNTVKCNSIKMAMIITESHVEMVHGIKQEGETNDFFYIKT